MSFFFSTLQRRNPILYTTGWVSFVGAIICVLLSFLTHTQVLGINAFIKPAKFFISIALFCWTMGWYTGLLSQRRKVTIYSWVVVVTMFIEMVIITGQAAQGKLSHFNISTPLDARLFDVMGVSIVLLTCWTAYIGYLFFKHPPTAIEAGYLWGIRLGIIVFVFFAFEGFAMAVRLAHTIGAPDGGPGLPALNWSTHHGDLRIAHFFGMHALQIIPLFGYYIARRPFQIILFSLLYVSAVTALLLEAIAGKPLLSGL